MNRLKAIFIKTNNVDNYMKLSLLYVLLIVVCFSSCSNNSQPKCYSIKAQQRTFLTEETLPQLEKLKV